MSDEGMDRGGTVPYQSVTQAISGTINYMASQDGFTLYDTDDLQLPSQ